jgi:hypothetical protein
VPLRSTFMRRRRSVPSGRNFRGRENRLTLFHLGIYVIEIMGIILFTYVLSGIWGRDMHVICVVDSQSTFLSNASSFPGYKSVGDHTTASIVNLSYEYPTIIVK